MKNIYDLKIDISDLMIVCGHLQKKINEITEDKNYWFNRFIEVEKELKELKEPKEGLPLCKCVGGSE